MYTTIRMVKQKQIVGRKWNTSHSNIATTRNAYANVLAMIDGAARFIGNEMRRRNATGRNCLRHARTSVYAEHAAPTSSESRTAAEPSRGLQFGLARSGQKTNQRECLPRGLRYTDPNSPLAEYTNHDPRISHYTIIHHSMTYIHDTETCVYTMLKHVHAKTSY